MGKAHQRREQQPFDVAAVIGIKLGTEKGTGRASHKRQKRNKLSYDL